MKTMPQPSDRVSSGTPPMLAPADATRKDAPRAERPEETAGAGGMARRRAILPPWRTLAAFGAAAGTAAALASTGMSDILAAIGGLGAAVALDRLALRLGRDQADEAAPDGSDLPPAASDAQPEHAAPAVFAWALVDALPSPLLAISSGGRVVHANPAAQAIFPRLVPDGHYAGLIRAPEFVAAVEAALAGGEGGTVTFAAAPGRERIFDARLSPLPEESGFDGEVRLLVQIEDRTEARRAEQLRSDFIANASHELRTPLASIIGYIETLQNHAREDAAARERFLGIMEREAGRMQRLVDDLMSLSRIELSEHVRPRAACALTDIAGEAASALLPLAESEGIRLAIALPETSVIVQGDRDQLYQVFSNLVDNAIKYAGRGATIRLAAAAPSRAFPNCVGVSVSDDGPGIPREHLPRLTERFFRVSAGQSRTRGGTGLGLAIVKHILNRHEGRLEIASTVGVGSTFTVWLQCKAPLDPPEPRAPNRAGASREAGAPRQNRAA